MTQDGINRTAVEMTEGVKNEGFQADEEEVAGIHGAQGESNPSLVLSPDGEESAYTQIKPYAGMPKEVLLLYSNQVRYRLPREILFWLMIACTVALIALTIAVIAVSPRCLGWWQSSAVYQIYPRSFKDSDNDGIGDLKGIEEKLEHFEYLNIKTIWIGPFYKSPMKDFGYDVEDFRDIDPLFGTMQDFENLLASMHNKGLKLIMDYIPNHSSDKHRWFLLSRNRTKDYEDYYIWTNCTPSTPPNNWVSVFGNSSWTYDEVREQCYLHQFLKEQPDLNFRNPRVREEMTDIIRFWLNKGVDGFRMDAVKHILEAQHLRNEPQVDPNQPPLFSDHSCPVGKSIDILEETTPIKIDTLHHRMKEDVDSEADLYHDYTTSQLGLHDILRDWRVEMDKYSREPGRHRFMVTESYDNEEISKTMMYYGTATVKESDFPFNFYLIDLPDHLSGGGAFDLVNLWMTNMPKGKWPNWVVGNHDKPRIATTAGETYIRVINMLLLTLPGTPTTYYGEEIGMENVHVSDGEIQDPFGQFNPNASRDPQRSPMQWSADENAGFSQNKTWLPIHPNYTTVNVESQRSEKGSVLDQYRTLSLLRRAELALHRGWACFVHRDANVFAFVRELDGLPRAFLVVLNLGGDALTDLSGVPELPDELTVRVGTSGREGQRLRKSEIDTKAGEGLVLEYSSGRRLHPGHASSCFVSERACYLSALDILYKC